jgi:hypothetical protein
VTLGCYCDVFQSAYDDALSDLIARDRLAEV